MGQCQWTWLLLTTCIRGSVGSLRDRGEEGDEQRQRAVGLAERRVREARVVLPPAERERRRDGRARELAHLRRVEDGRAALVEVEAAREQREVDVRASAGFPLGEYTACVQRIGGLRKYHAPSAFSYVGCDAAMWVRDSTLCLVSWDDPAEA